MKCNHSVTTANLMSPYHRGHIGLGHMGRASGAHVQVNFCQKLLFLHQYMKIPSSNLRRTCCAQKLFLTFRMIFVHNMFCKRRASDKNLPVRSLEPASIEILHNIFKNYTLLLAVYPLNDFFPATHICLFVFLLSRKNKRITT